MIDLTNPDNLLPCESKGYPIPCGTRVLFIKETPLNTIRAFAKVVSVCGNSVGGTTYGLRLKPGAKTLYVNAGSILAMEPKTRRGEPFPVLSEWLWRNPELYPEPRERERS